MLVTYAQNFEDVMLWRALRHIENGRYLDIGAQDPVHDSVSNAFYEKGWRGWHVEPTVKYSDALRSARPDETVLAVAIGNGGGMMRFHEFPETGLSTLDDQVAERHVREGLKRIERQVPVVSLAGVLDDMSGGGGDIHWMKIDVEGAERSVLESWGDSPVRPWILVIESTLPRSQELSHQDWEALVLDRGYRFAYFDGLNRFYIAAAHTELLPAFDAPPNLFDDFAFNGTGLQSFGVLMRQEAQRHEQAAHEAAIALQSVRTELQVANAELQAVNEGLQAAKAEVQVARGEVQQANERHAVDLAALAEMERIAHADRLRAEQAELSVKQVELGSANLTDQLNASLSNAHHWFLRATDAEHQFSVVVSSRSWRLTRGLRFAARLLRTPVPEARRLAAGAMRRVMRRPHLARWLNAVIRRFPALHHRLRRVAVQEHVIETPPAPPRALLGQVGSFAHADRGAALAMLTEQGKRWFEKLKAEQ